MAETCSCTEPRVTISSTKLRGKKDKLKFYLNKEIEFEIGKFAKYIRAIPDSTWDVLGPGSNRIHGYLDEHVIIPPLSTRAGEADRITRLSN